MSVSTVFVVATVALLVFVVVMAAATTSALTPDSDRQPPRPTAEPADDRTDSPAEATHAATEPAATDTAPTDTVPDEPVTADSPSAAGADTTHSGTDVTPSSGETTSPSAGSTEHSVTPAQSDPDALQSGQPSLDDLSTTMLFANVLGTHGLFAALLLGVAVWTGVPWETLGIGAPAIDAGDGSLVALGSVLGVALYVGNELLAVNLDRIDVAYSESLREGLAPETAGGWIVLLVVILPVVAGFEELLFRAAAIGGLSAGLSISPWLLLVVSTVAFALGHGIQGPGGVLVTGLLGGVLGVVFVVTNSLLVVFVAHYVVNALEFLVHEGLGVDAERWFTIGW